MRAFLIKPETQTIEEVDFKGTLEHLYELIDAPITERVTLGEPSQPLDIWVDEEGLYRPSTVTKGTFKVDLYTLTGNALATGEIYDPVEGGNFGPVPDNWTLERMKQFVRFE